MSQASDLKTFRSVLRQAVAALHRPTRDLERDLGISNGGLERLLDGRQDIRLHHILAFAQVLGVSPSELLEHGCPDAHAAARHKLGDWIGPVEPKFKKKKPDPAAAPSKQELAELIRQTVREELAVLSTRKPDEES